MSAELGKTSNIFVLGTGGREDAISWKLSQHIPRENIFAASPRYGNPIDVDPENVDSIRRAAHDYQIGFVVVGPEVPLIRGVVDGLQEDGVLAFGPTKEAALKSEGSKWEAIKIMRQVGIPHPQSEYFQSPHDLLRFWDKHDPKEFVMKADGLAAGKGVVLLDTYEEAREATHNFMVKKIFGDAGRNVVVQRREVGREVSVQAFSDGENVVMSIPIADNKRLLDGDKGPNTGGMGTYGPVPFVTAGMMEVYKNTIVQPFIDAMRNNGTPFTGRLYPGIIETAEGPKVLEFNCRFGDPETQVEMMLLQSQLLPILKACVNGDLKQEQVQYREGSATCVVMAAPGYPGAYPKGIPIEGLDRITNPNVRIFHAGTEIKDDRVVSKGGRVLGVTAYAKTLSESLDLANNSIDKNNGVYFQGEHHRADIGRRTA